MACNKTNLRKADECGEKLMFIGKNSRKFPVNNVELEKYCSETTKIIQCVKRFTDKCARNDIEKNLANVMLYTVRSVHKSTCGSKKKRGMLVSMANCVNSLRKKSSSLLEGMLVEYGQAMALNDKSFRVPYACW